MTTYIEYSKVRTFPYKHLTKADQHVVARFFDSAPFHAHGWDMFVPPHLPPSLPILTCAGHIIATSTKPPLSTFC
jgi:hypothetical protein